MAPFTGDTITTVWLAYWLPKLDAQYSQLSDESLQKKRASREGTVTGTQPLPHTTLQFPFPGGSLGFSPDSLSTARATVCGWWVIHPPSCISLTIIKGNVGNSFNGREHTPHPGNKHSSSQLPAESQSYSEFSPMTARWQWRSRQRQKHQRAHLKSGGHSLYSGWNRE